MFFDGGASPNDIDKMSPDMGEALALVPISHEPVAVFPLFSIHQGVPFSFRATLCFYLMNALVYFDIDQGIH